MRWLESALCTAAQGHDFDASVEPQLAHCVMDLAGGAKSLAEHKSQKRGPRTERCGTHLKSQHSGDRG
jgi:hypothetical protein